jgi:hypothetical protein
MREGHLSSRERPFDQEPHKNPCFGPGAPDDEEEEYHEVDPVYEASSSKRPRPRVGWPRLLK